MFIGSCLFSHLFSFYLAILLVIWHSIEWLCLCTWYDMVWYGMVWYGMVWYDMIWYDMIKDLLSSSAPSVPHALASFVWVKSFGGTAVVCSLLFVDRRSHGFFHGFNQRCVTSYKSARWRYCRCFNRWLPCRMSRWQCFNTPRNRTPRFPAQLPTVSCSHRYVASRTIVFVFEVFGVSVKIQNVWRWWWPC